MLPVRDKTAVRALLADRLPDLIVLDWDDLIEPASALAGTARRQEQPGDVAGVPNADAPGR